jgi:hypothetical protein
MNNDELLAQMKGCIQVAVDDIDCLIDRAVDNIDSNTDMSIDNIDCDCDCSGLTEQIKEINKRLDDLDFFLRTSLVEMINEIKERD